ncbi:MAG: signal peptidase II [Candidatus Moranbacteria bacterium]|nr:signal peptidase II [Candidatus Moranbacteria bacterium]
MKVRYHVPSTEKGRDAMAFAALLFSDLSIKAVFMGHPGSSCNPFGPLGVSGDSSTYAAVSAIVLGGLAVVSFRGDMRYGRLPLIFILAGGIGNLVDRILWGCVRDFSVVSWFPAFNLADVWLTVGAVWFVFAYLSERSDG